MRVLVVHPGPHFSVADVYNGLVKGLTQNGCEVGALNLDARLDFYVGAHIKKGRRWVRAFQYEDAVRLAAKWIVTHTAEFRPDLVVVVSSFFVPPDVFRTVRALGAHLAVWMTESPYEDDRQLHQAPAADTVVLNDPMNLAEYRDVNPRTYYIGHAYDPAVHHPGPAKPGYESDFCFVGTGYESRIRFLEQVDWTGIDVSLAGNWRQLTDASPLRGFVSTRLDECIDNADAADLYRSTKVSLNLYRKEANDADLVDGWACGPREIELAACETFYLREPRGESDELFPMLPTFDTPGEVGDLTRWWMAHPEERETAARKAREAVAARTFQANAAELLHLCGF